MSFKILKKIRLLDNKFYVVGCGHIMSRMSTKFYTHSLLSIIGNLLASLTNCVQDKWCVNEKKLSYSLYHLNCMLIHNNIGVELVTML